MGVRDNNKLIRSAGALTGDETIAFTLEGGNVEPHLMAVGIKLPQAFGAGDTIKFTARCVTTKHKIEVSHTDLVSGAVGTYPRLLHLPLPPSKGTAWELFIDITDAGGGFDAGVVLAWLELADANALVDNTS